MSDLTSQQQETTNLLNNSARLRIKSTRVPQSREAPLQNAEQKIASTANPRKTDIELEASVAKLFSGQNFDESTQNQQTDSRRYTVSDQLTIPQTRSSSSGGATDTLPLTMSMSSRLDNLQ